MYRFEWGNCKACACVHALLVLSVLWGKTNTWIVYVVHMQVILTAGGEVPVAMRLCRALAAWTQTYACSPQHLQQHLAVALADSLLPAAVGWSLSSDDAVDSEQAVGQAMQAALRDVSPPQVRLCRWLADSWAHHAPVGGLCSISWKVEHMQQFVGCCCEAAHILCLPGFVCQFQQEY
jgi:transcriptional regulator GlxA family with amidase domain